MSKQPHNPQPVIDVYLDDTVLNTTFEFPAGLQAAEPLFENREPIDVKPGATAFSDCFEPFDVHVYRIAVGEDSGND